MWGKKTKHWLPIVIFGIFIATAMLAHLAAQRFCFGHLYECVCVCAILCVAPGEYKSRKIKARGDVSSCGPTCML